MPSAGNAAYVVFNLSLQSKKGPVPPYEGDRSFGCGGRGGACLMVARRGIFSGNVTSGRATVAARAFAGPKQDM